MMTKGNDCTIGNLKLLNSLQRLLPFGMCAILRLNCQVSFD